MLRKCGLFVLSLAVLSTSFSVFFSDVSRAWSYSSQPVICSTVPSFPLEYVQSNVDDFDPDTWPWAIVGYKDGSGNITSYKFFTQVPSSGTFQWVHGTDRGLTNANITTWPQYAYWLWLTGAYVSIPSLDSTGSTWGVRTNATGGTGMMFSGTSGDNECLASHSNIPRTTTFNTNFGESTPIDGTYTPPPVDGGCAPLDIGCWFADFIDVTVTTIQEAWSAFVDIFVGFSNWLGNLLVPDDGNIFLNAFTDLNDYMHNKLGFLTYPFVFIQAQITALMTIVDSDNKDEWHCTGGGSSQYGVCSGLCAPNVLGSQGVCIRLSALEENFPTLWQTGVWFLRLAVVGVLIELMRNKYMSIVRA